MTKENLYRSFCIILHICPDPEQAHVYVFGLSLLITSAYYKITSLNFQNPILWQFNRGKKSCSSEEKKVVGANAEITCEI